jgi:hypothetical protein
MRLLPLSDCTKSSFIDKLRIRRAVMLPGLWVVIAASMVGPASVSAQHAPPVTRSGVQAPQAFDAKAAASVAGMAVASPLHLTFSMSPWMSAVAPSTWKLAEGVKPPAEIDPAETSANPQRDWHFPSQRKQPRGPLDPHGLVSGFRFTYEDVQYNPAR